jgi:S1-C subfamily serine protease
VRPLALLLAVLLAGTALAPRARAADALDALQDRIIDVSERLTPSVVHIEAVVKVDDRRQMVTGSGLLTSPDGVVLTNEHVVDRAEKISVIVPDRSGRYSGESVGVDKQTDLAVVRIAPRVGEPPFHAATLGDSDAVKVGEWVIAIGNPYGLDGTVSLGIVSAKGRDLASENLINDFIQTDAMIDRGSSGGPLVNLRGEVVGLNSRGQGRGIGFTIPINTAKRVAADLLGSGQIARAWLGVSIQPLDRELAEYWKLAEVEGVVVNGVAEGSPAARAGLAPGDIVTLFDRKKVRAEKEDDLGEFQRMIATASVGEEVELAYLREGKERRARVTLGVQPKVVPDEAETGFGFTVQEVTEHLVRRHRLDRREGVMVSFVERGSEAEEAGLTAGDLIERVAEAPVTDIGGFRSAMEAVSPDRPFLLYARRGTDLRFLLIVPRRGDAADSRSKPTRSSKP